jgi:hypothetical protein
LGRLVEIVKLEYTGRIDKSTLLFKCEWFDPTPAGTKVNEHYRLVDINHKRRFNRYEPFVLASQADQVYYCSYPSLKQDKVDWWAACKIKARSNVEFIEPLPEQSFQEDVVHTRNSIPLLDNDFQLIDPNPNDIDVQVEELVDDMDDDSLENELMTENDTSEEDFDDTDSEG